MQRFRMALAVAATTCGLLAGSFASTQPDAQAASAPCDSGFGTKVPVLMVHGFNSNPRMWGGLNSMKDVIEKMVGTHVVEPFDYESTHLSWVTDPTIGPRLAATIDCLAQASLRGGGRGKVIVVAHSMGGLAVQYAANQAVDGRRVADEIGLVVTIATPYTGSLLGNAGAGSLAALCQEAVGTVTFSPLLGVLSRD